MRRIKNSKKRMPAQKLRKVEPAAIGSASSLEKGILALLSFLGHSYHKGTISDELFEKEKSAALRNLDSLRIMEREHPDEEAESGSTRKEKLLKNKDDIESLLEFLEDSYHEGTVSEKSYRELKAENLKKLSRVNNLLGRYVGKEVELDSPTDVYGQFSSELSEKESPALEDYEEGDEDYAETPQPELEEKQVKPISIRDSLEKYASGNEADAQPAEADDIMGSLRIGKRGRTPIFEEESEYSREGTDDIMQSLKITKPPRQTAEDPSYGYGEEEAQVRESDMLDKISGIVGGLRGKKESAETAEAQGLSGLPDKLPEEMTAEELASAEKQRQEAQEEPSRPEAPMLSGDGDGGGENTKLVLEIEKLKVKLESLEGMRSVVEERIEHIMENIGELRTMLFEKESSGKEQEAKLDKFVEMVSDLEPQRFAKELDKRDKQLAENSLKVEKLETITSDMVQSVGRLRAMLDAIGSLKNIATLSRDIADRSSKIDNTVSKVERLADETGRVYVELNRKLNEFTLYRGKQDIMSESLKELVSMSESLSNKLDNYVSKEDARDIGRQLEDAKLSINEMQTKIALASEGDELPSHVKDLQEEKEGLEQILESNEEEFIEGQIKEVEYKKMKDLHTRKLQTVREKLRVELSKIRKERSQQDARSKQITQNVQQTAAENSDEGEEEGEQEGTEERETEEAGETEVEQPREGKPAPTGNIQRKIPPSQKSVKQGVTGKTLQQISKIKSKVREAEEPEIEGELDEEALQKAEEVSKEEIEKQEAEELEESIEEEAEEEPIAPKRLQKASGIEKIKPKKLISAPPTLSLKTENTLPSKGGLRVYDVIKNASEGKKVTLNATATTVKKNVGQCLIKLEDESGVIYGIYSSPLKGEVTVRAVLAKDPQGVPYLKVIKAA